MEALQQFDASIFTTINSWHALYFDNFMALVTVVATWLPMILMLLFMLYRKKGWRKMLAILLAVGVVILIADQVSASIIKPLVGRLRPSRNPDLQSTIHLVNGYRGGMFGFVSSHAANCFGIALFLAFLFKNRAFTWLMIAWASLMCYSRIYLGVHYPGDIVCGAILGVTAAAIVYYLMKWLGKKKPEWFDISFTPGEARQMIYAAFANVILLALLAVIMTIFFKNNAIFFLN
ncbi:MAG: phosphatase PAP2 family protein [Muribaculaceae bacterium]|nr:phosphatase PAP2 family protein [Muribaculaceae bacterium]